MQDGFCVFEVTIGKLYLVPSAFYFIDKAYFTPGYLRVLGMVYSGNWKDHKNFIGIMT